MDYAITTSQVIDMTVTPAVAKVRVTINLSNFGPADLTQQAGFGKLAVDFGGSFSTAGLSFQLPPAIQLIDMNSSPFAYTYDFAPTVEITNILAAANLFANTCLTRLTTAVTAWRAQTFTALNLTGTL